MLEIKSRHLTWVGPKSSMHLSVILMKAYICLDLWMEVYVNKASSIVNYNFVNSDSRVPKYSTTTNDPINAGMLF